MANQEYHIVIKKEEYEKLNYKITTLESKIMKIEKSIYNFENKKNVIEFVFYKVNHYFESFLLYLFDFIIDIPAE